MAKAIVETVHFTVDPDGLTRLVRDIWAEGNYKKALGILEAAKYGEPLPIAVQHDIIRGKNKFARYRNQRDSFCIKADRWKSSKGTRYPDPDEIPEIASKVAKLEDDLAFYKRPTDVPEEEEVEKPKKVLPDVSRLPKRFAGYASLDEMNMALLMKRNLPTVDQYLADAASRDEREAAGKPKPDRALSAEMGWVVPDGKFYACLTKQEHIWLCHQFGLTESAAEKLGWIKITKDLLDKNHIFKGAKEPTQKQINTVFDWCEKHNYELPEWAGGKD